MLFDIYLYLVVNWSYYNILSVSCWFVSVCIYVVDKNIYC